MAPTVFTILPHRSFADALVARYRGLADRLIAYFAAPQMERDPQTAPRWAEVARADEHGGVADQLVRVPPVQLLERVAVGRQQVAGDQRRHRAPDQVGGRVCPLLR